MSTTAVDHAHDHSHDHDHAHDHPHGWRRWLFATNHKDIGTLYLWFSFTMLLSGGVLALLIRAELFQPGLQFFKPEFFNQLTTMHGLIMVFGAIMPAFVGFANWMIPLQIGASDMAFARMNNFSFWLLPVAASLLTSNIVNENHRYRLPMSLWLVANSQRRQPVGMSWCSPCSCSWP
jgi:cytochrome c oxidase subunit 1